MANARFKSSAGVVKQGRLAFTPGTVYGFEDPDAVPFFVNMGWADETDDPADVEISQDALSIDPETTFADGPRKGQRVIGG